MKGSLNINLCIIIYIISFLIILSIVHDFKYIHPQISDLLNIKIYAKLYSIITIIIIHSGWLFLTFMADYKGTSYFYGIPSCLFVSYIILFVSYIPYEEHINLNEETKNINKMLNDIIFIYFMFILLITIIPNEYKRNIVSIIQNKLHYYIFNV